LLLRDNIIKNQPQTVCQSFGPNLVKHMHKDIEPNCINSRGFGTLGINSKTV
jgi:hypothetical protein